MPRDRVAVVGGGISGIAASWALRDVADVVLFEAADRLGGHTDTRMVTTVPGEASFPVDIGFIVYNRVTYPLLSRWFDELEVPSRPTNMSFGVECGGCGLAYSGLGPRGAFASFPGTLRLRHLQTLLDIPRFARMARAGCRTEERLVDLVQRGGLSRWFERHYLGPLAAALWSTAIPDVRAFPARTLLDFLASHRLLGFSGRLGWRTVVGGSRAYLEAALARLPCEVRTATPVRAITREQKGVWIATDGQPAERFDQVVVAVHADRALDLLEAPTERESRALGVWSYTESEAWLHSDPDWLPEAKAARASWIYQLEDCANPSARPTMTYNLNRLQAPPTRQPVLVTLNPRREPRSAHAVRSFRHPMFTHRSVASQEAIGQLGGETRTYFCGAYQGFGFHEDGFRSGVEAARRIGGRFP